MNWKSWVPLVAAILLGGIAAKVARDMAMKGHGKGTAPTKTLQMVIAKGLIAPGTELTSDQVAVVTANSDTPVAGSYTTPQDVVGRVVTAPLVDGEPIRQGVLAPVGTAAGLAALIPSGMRAITIDVNEITGIAGLLTPGCHVDLDSTIDGSESARSQSRTILANVLVTAVGPRMTPTRAEGDKDQGYHTVTLIVTPRQALLVELASTTAKTRLALRAHGDNTPVEPNGVTLAELRGKGATASNIVPVTPVELSGTTQPTTRPVVATAAAKWTTLVIRAGAVTNVDFDMPVPTAVTDTDQRPAFQP